MTRSTRSPNKKPAPKRAAKRVPVFDYSNPTQHYKEAFAYIDQHFDHMEKVLGKREWAAQLLNISEKELHIFTFFTGTAIPERVMMAIANKAYQ
eukprot:1273324-Karenia_brevis.AAC.1